MTNRQIPELNYLLAKVEKKYGQSIKTTTDFEALSVVIERDTGELLSASTLKRLWGYVSLNPAPRVSTLDILSRYLDWKNFEEFRVWLKTTPDFESTFFTTQIINVSDLKSGSRVLIGWNPNRLVELEYHGGHRFTVISNENSQLQKDDEFELTSLMLGYPLYISRILRNGEYTPAYVAGKIEGLNLLKIVK